MGSRNMLSFVTSFLQNNNFSIHPCRSTYQYFVLFFLEPNNVLLYGCITSDAPWLIDIWVFSTFFGCYEKYCYERACAGIFSEHKSLILLGTYLGAAFMTTLSNLLRNSLTISKSGCTILGSHQQYMRVPKSLHPASTCRCLCLFNYSHPSGCEVVSRSGFDLHFSNHENVQHLFMCLLEVCVFSLEKCLLTSFVHF